MAKRGRGRPRKEIVQAPATAAPVAAAAAVDEEPARDDGVSRASDGDVDNDDDANDDDDDDDDDDDPDAPVSANERVSTRPWTKSEDDRLNDLIAKFGAKRWSFIAGHMPQRKGKQCRDRYLNHLRPGIKTGEWSREEEKVLVEGHKILGSKWSALAKLLVGRPENAIKNHWHATMRCKWTNRHMDAHLDGSTLTELQRYQMSLKTSEDESAGKTKAKDEWSPAEETVLIEAHKILGANWSALVKLIAGRSEHAIKNHWHENHWQTKQAVKRKLANEPGEHLDESTLTELQRYQMSLIMSGEKSAVSKAEAGWPSQARGMKTTQNVVAVVDAFIKATAGELGIASTSASDKDANAVATVAGEDVDAAEDVENDGQIFGVITDTEDPDFAVRKSLPPPTHNTQRTDHERANINGHATVKEEVSLMKACDDDVGRDISTTSDATAAVDVAPSPSTTAPLSDTAATASPDGYHEPSKKMKKKSLKKVLNVVQVGEGSAIDVAQCVSIVGSLGSPEVSTLTSVATTDGESYIQDDPTLSHYVIEKGLSNIAEVIRVRWPVHRVAIAVRVGTMKAGDVKLCVCVSGDAWTDVVAASEFASTQVKSKYLFAELKAVYERFQQIADAKAAK